MIERVRGKGEKGQGKGEGELTIRSQCLRGSTVTEWLMHFI